MKFPGQSPQCIEFPEFPGQSPQCINSTQNLRFPRPILQSNCTPLTMTDNIIFVTACVLGRPICEFPEFICEFPEFPGQSPQCINSTQNLRFPRPILQPN